MKEREINVNELKSNDVPSIKKFTPIRCNDCRWKGVQDDLLFDHNYKTKKNIEGSSWLSYVIIHRCPDCKSENIKYII